MAPRDVAGEEHGAVGIADVDGIRQRQQSVGEHAVGELFERRRDMTDFRRVLRRVELREILHGPFDDVARVLRRLEALRLDFAIVRYFRRKSLRDLLERVDGGLHAARGDAFARQRLRRGIELACIIHGRAALLVTDAAQTPQLGRRQVETIPLSFPRDRRRRRVRPAGQRGEHRLFGARSRRQRRAKRLLNPSRHSPGVSPVVIHGNGDEARDERLRARRVDRARAGHARDERERPLQLREHREAATGIQRRHTVHAPGRLGVHLRIGDADALERQHQHPQPWESSDRGEHWRERLVSGVGEHTLSEGKLIGSLLTISHVAVGDVLGEPCRIDDGDAVIAARLSGRTG